jgi:predicted nucleotide-binding protein (sugar kinase/HSP70/actin superfamily)
MLFDEIRRISELLEFKEPFIGSSYWRKTNDLFEQCTKIKEDYQKEVHNQIKNGPEELDWILNPLHEKIEKILSHKYKKNEKEIIFVSNAEDSISMIQ